MTLGFAETDLEKTIQSYQAAVLIVLDDGGVTHIALYPTKGMELGKKLLKDIEESDLPTKRKKITKDIVESTMEFYKALEKILKVPQYIG